MLPSRKKLILSILLLVVAIPTGYYLLSPLFVSVTVKEEAPAKSQSESIVLKMGNFVGADGFHQASGIAKMIRMADGSYVIRFEEFQATNGPDLYVYLASSTDASTFLNLGRLKGNIGSQNYEVPAGTNPSSFRYVLIWCRAFSVLFGYAELA